MWDLCCVTADADDRNPSVSDSHASTSDIDGKDDMVTNLFQ